MPDWLSYSIVCVYGAIVGSFLNVLIWRLPRDESIVKPPSHCTACGYLLRPWDNIPLASWLLYRGRCRKCGVRISSRYFWVELLTGVLWGVVFWRFGWSLEFFQYASVTSALIAVFAIDLEHYIIPDQLWMFAAAVGFAADAAGLVAQATGTSWLVRYFPWQGLQHIPFPWTGFEIVLPCSVVGFVLYGGLVLLVGIAGEALFRKEAMGFGDVKLTAAIGANIGAAYGLVSFFLAAGVGAVAGIVLMLAGRKQRMDEIPFGPMLVVGAMIMMLFGRQVINWWLGYAGLR